MQSTLKYTKIFEILTDIAYINISITHAIELFHDYEFLIRSRWNHYALSARFTIPVVCA